MAGNHQSLNLAGTLTHQHKGGVTVVTLDIEFFGVAKAAVDTQGIQCDLLAHFRGKKLRHTCFQVTALAAVFPARRLLQQEASGLDFRGHIRQFELNGLVLRDGLAEGRALLRIPDGVIEGRLSEADSTGCNVDTANLKPAHGMFETLSLAAAKQAGHRDMDSVKNKFSRIYALVAQFFKSAADCQAWRALFDEKDAHTAIRRLSAGISTRQYREDAGMDAIGNPQLGAIDDVILAVPRGGHGDSLYITACVRFRDTQSPAFVALGHHWEETPALLFSAMRVNHIGDKHMGVDDTGQAHPAARA